jgi:hypothetical protein
MSNPERAVKILRVNDIKKEEFYQESSKTSTPLKSHTRAYMSVSLIHM